MKFLDRAKLKNSHQKFFMYSINEEISVDFCKLNHKFLKQINKIIMYMPPYNVAYPIGKAIYKLYYS